MYATLASRQAHRFLLDRVLSRLILLSKPRQTNSQAKYTPVARYGMLRFAQHDNRGVSTGHAERSKAESKHLSALMPNVHWITVVYLAPKYMDY